MNNKYKIGDKVRMKQDELSCISGFIVTICESQLPGIDYMVKDNTGTQWNAMEEDIAQPYIEEDKKKASHHLTYSIYFDNPYGTNCNGDRYNVSKSGLVEDFTESLKALMDDSAKRGIFEIPTIEWQYTDIEKLIEEDTIDDDVIESVIDLDRTQEPTMTLDEYNKLHNAKKCDATVGLDYKVEYEHMKTAHMELVDAYMEQEELLEIAKIALKLTTELISTND